MKKGMRIHDISVKDLKGIIACCKDYDITEGQLVFEKTVPGFEFGRYSDEYANELKSVFADIHICVLGSYINPSATNPEELKTGLDRFKEKIRYASVLKPTVVGTETGFYGDEMSDDVNNTEEAYQHLLKNVSELVKEAEKYDVCVGIEGVHCFVINSPDRMERLLNDLGSDNVRVIFDPVNLINISNYKQQDDIINAMFDKVGEKIVVLHAKDFVIEDESLKMVIPGEGLLNYKLIFERMKKLNLDLPIIAEELDEKKAALAFENLAKIQKSIL